MVGEREIEKEKNPHLGKESKKNLTPTFSTFPLSLLHVVSPQKNKNTAHLGKMLPPQALQQMGGAGALQGLLKAFEGAAGAGGGKGGGGGPFG